jgi:hypothetical protein
MPECGLAGGARLLRHGVETPQILSVFRGAPPQYPSGVAFINRVVGILRKVGFSDADAARTRWIRDNWPAE